jgi:AcrR family transcriptional regulator
MPKPFVEQNRRNRIILAALEVFGEQGYAGPTVKDLIGEASVSRATFYKYFPDKRACFRAVHEEVLAWLEENARDAAREAEDWQGAVRAVSRRLVRLLVEDPRLARICTVDWILGGEEVHSHHQQALERLADGLRQGRTERPQGKDLPPCLEPFLLAGAVSLVSQSVVFGFEPNAEALSRDLPDLILGFYLGL